MTKTERIRSHLRKTHDLFNKHVWKRSWNLNDWISVRECETCGKIILMSEYGEERSFDLLHLSSVSETSVFLLNELPADMRKEIGKELERLKWADESYYRRQVVKSLLKGEPIRRIDY